MNTYMNTTRFIALSAILAVMGLASSGAVAAGKSALPVSDPYSKKSQLARTAASKEFKPVATKEGEIMILPESGRSAIYKNGQWVYLPFSGSCTPMAGAC